MQIWDLKFINPVSFHTGEVKSTMLKLFFKLITVVYM